MIEKTTKRTDTAELAMIEDAMNWLSVDDLQSAAGRGVEKKPLKRRMVVTSILALAALGAHCMHGNPLPNNDSEPTASRTASRQVASDEGAKFVKGPNSLFGDVSIDQKLNVPMAGEIGTSELDLSSLATQAGMADAAPSLASADADWSKQVELGGGSDVSALPASAVPEPGAAAMLLLAAAPAVSLRRPRHRAKERKI